MTVTHYDATIEGSQLITANTKVILAIDFTEINNQSFTIGSGTVVIYDSAGDEAISSIDCTFSDGLRSSKRVKAEVLAADTASLTAGHYYAIWSLTLGDTQTRKVKQAIQIRSVA